MALLPAQGSHGQGRHGPVHRLRPQRVHLQPGLHLGRRKHVDGAPPRAARAHTPVPRCELASPCAAGHAQRGRPCRGGEVRVDGEAEYAAEVVQVARRPRALPGLSLREGARSQAEGRLSTTVEAVRPAEPCCPWGAAKAAAAVSRCRSPAAPAFVGKCLKSVKAPHTLTYFFYVRAFRGGIREQGKRSVFYTPCETKEPRRR